MGFCWTGWGTTRKPLSSLSAIPVTNIHQSAVLFSSDLDSVQTEYLLCRLTSTGCNPELWVRRQEFVKSL
jgi:hypothetical protein